MFEMLASCGNAARSYLHTGLLGSGAYLATHRAGSYCLVGSVMPGRRADRCPALRPQPLPTAITAAAAVSATTEGATAANSGAEGPAEHSTMNGSEGPDGVHPCTSSARGRWPHSSIRIRDALLTESTCTPSLGFFLFVTPDAADHGGG